MANPTVANLISSLREIARNKTTIHIDDTAAGTIGFVTSGLEQGHMFLRALLNGQVPRPDHFYWKNFFVPKAISISSGTTDYTLPTAETEKFDIFHSLIDDSTLHPFEPYELTSEVAIRRGLERGVVRGNRFAWLPSGKIRLLTQLGSRGTPQATMAVTLRFFRDIQHHTATNETVDLPHELCEGALHWGVGKAIASRGGSPSPWYATARELWTAIAQGAIG